MEKIEIVYNNLRFEIENDLPEIGSYLYVYKDNECIGDYLQDNIDSCKQFALEEYGVPIELWLESKDCSEPH